MENSRNRDHSRDDISVLIDKADRERLFVVVTEPDGTIRSMNRQFEAICQCTAPKVAGKNIWDVLETSGRTPDPRLREIVSSVIENEEPWHGCILWGQPGENSPGKELFLSPIYSADPGTKQVIWVGRNAAEELQREHSRLQAQKLEDIGRLASGIAHEINTPTQYIGDNLRFFQEIWNDLKQLIAFYGGMKRAVEEGQSLESFRDRLQALAEEIDLDYILEETPDAIEQAMEGNRRVAEIVQAMREFAHPGEDESAGIDVNRVIQSTIMVTRNEWRYSAEIVQDLDPDVPIVPGVSSAFSQVILNLIINAVHAIRARNKDEPNRKGTITIVSRKRQRDVEIRISDTGTGIPEAIRDRIFEPFFTTKPLGEGTGHGLAIAHSIIVRKHHGTITVESEEGKGTTFIIRLPLGGDTYWS